MDDEEDIRESTGDVFKRLGYTVEFSYGRIGLIGDMCDISDYN
jgi:hypothetical protein